MVGDDAGSEDNFFYLSPTYGQFLNDNILLEGSLTYMSSDQFGGDPETYLGINMQYFINNFFIGAKFSTGASLLMKLGSSTQYLASATSFEDDIKIMKIYKLGYMSNISNNFSLENSIKYITQNQGYRDLNMVQIGLSLKYFF